MLRLVGLDERPTIYRGLYLLGSLPLRGRGRSHKPAPLQVRSQWVVSRPRVGVPRFDGRLGIVYKCRSAARLVRGESGFFQVEFRDSSPYLEKYR